MLTQPTAITAEMKLEDFFDNYPTVGQKLFTHYHIGNCGCCGFHEGETLASYCERKGDLNAQEILDFIQKNLFHPNP